MLSKLMYVVIAVKPVKQGCNLQACRAFSTHDELLTHTLLPTQHLALHY